VPVWNPDGRSLAYANAAGGVFVQEAHGGGGPKLLFPTKSFTPLSDWSRDGRLFFYDDVDWRTSHPNLEVRELQPAVSKRVSEATWGENSARLSPDGRWLAYASLESGDLEIMVRSFPGGGERRQVSAGGGAQPAWRGDGKELFYVSPDGKIMAADIRTEAGLEVGAPRALFQTRILPLVEARNNYDVTRDGQRFLVNSRRPEDALLPITVIAPWVSGAKP
jgi:Tol biopolymer transport system component